MLQDHSSWHCLSPCLQLSAAAFFTSVVQARHPPCRLRGHESACPGCSPRAFRRQDKVDARMAFARGDPLDRPSRLQLLRATQRIQQHKHRLQPTDKRVGHRRRVSIVTHSLCVFLWSVDRTGGSAQPRIPLRRHCPAPRSSLRRACPMRCEDDVSGLWQSHDPKATTGSTNVVNTDGERERERERKRERERERDGAAGAAGGARAYGRSARLTSLDGVQ